MSDGMSSKENLIEANIVEFGNLQCFYFRDETDKQNPNQSSAKSCNKDKIMYS